MSNFDTFEFADIKRLMFSKVNILSTFVNTIWGVFGGILLWGVIADPLMEQFVTEGVLKPGGEIDPFFMTLGFFFMAFGFSTIYGRYAQKDYGPVSGFQMGLLVGLMLGVGKKLIDLGTANLMNLEGTLINSFVYVLFFGIMGILTGLIYKKFA